MQMEFKILGPLAIEEDGRSVDPGGPRQRALLAILLLHRREVVSAERLIDELYGSTAPVSAATSLRAQVSRLRKALRLEGIVQTRSGGYVLEPAPDTVDADRFERLVAEGRRLRADDEIRSAAERFREALGLWRGSALADFVYDDFAQSEIARLEELRIAAIEERIAAELDLGRHTELVGELERLVREFPVRERLRGQLMLALYRSERQSEALAVYQEGRRYLSEELGLEPGAPLRELEKAILRHESALDLDTSSLGKPMESEDSKGIFVGRARELEELRAGVDDAFAGHGRLFLLVGEPGIGKSRLVEEVMRQARARGARVLVGRCWEAGGAPAYWPWVQSLRAYIRDREPRELREELGPDAGDVAQLFPELRRLFPDLPEPPAQGSEGARFRLFDALAAFLENAARGRPLVLVLDDLHAADEPSLLLLRFLARELRASRLLIVGAYRDVDPTLQDPLVTALAELVREPVTQRLALDGIVEAEVAEYIALTTGVEPEPAVVEEIYAETDGNPLFVGEIVRLLAAEGRL
jgi:DNA-binding SARP family transcriptional activator